MTSSVEKSGKPNHECMPPDDLSPTGYTNEQHGVTMELRHCVITEPPTADFDWPMGTTADETPF